MKLSEKLAQLQDEAIDDELSREAIDDGFNRCIEDALYLETFHNDHLIFKDSLSGIKLITEERKRQMNEEGWTFEHDDAHEDGELANAAATYALTDETKSYIDEHWGNDNWLHFWPFDLKWLKRTPKNRIRELQKAGAMIAAEIDRLSRINPNSN